ncbi:hypothetical protein LguiA_034144 [Lonicera macranthoides]
MRIQRRTSLTRQSRSLQLIQCTKSVKLYYQTIEAAKTRCRRNCSSTNLISGHWEARSREFCKVSSVNTRPAYNPSINSCAHYMSGAASEKALPRTYDLNESRTLELGTSTEVDFSRYVLRLEEDKELPKRILNNISNSANRLI